MANSFASLEVETDVKESKDNARAVKDAIKGVTGNVQVVKDNLTGITYGIQNVESKVFGMCRHNTKFKQILKSLSLKELT